MLQNKIKSFSTLQEALIIVLSHFELGLYLVVFAKYFFCLGKKWRKNRPLIASPRMEAAFWAFL